MEAPRVVVVSKRHRLTTYLEQRLAQAGYLAGAVYEARIDGWRGKWRYLERLARREGRARAIDVAAYEAYDRAIRGVEFRRAAEAITPLGPDESSRGTEIPRVDVGSLNTEPARAAIAALRPDFLVVHGTAILEPETFKLAKVAALNIHCGILPDYRGHASTFWALARGDVDNVGVTVHHIASAVDTGLLTRQGRVPWRPGETDITMWCRALRLGADLVIDAVREWEMQGVVAALPYAGPPGPHYRRKGLSDYLRFRLHGIRPRRRGEDGPE